jgi:hypothetical protein
MLVLLQKSCDRLGLRHVVLTDEVTARHFMPEGMESFRLDLPGPLMLAVTEAQAMWLQAGDWHDADSLMVGADCLMLDHPDRHFPAREAAGLSVTMRLGPARYPINTGAILVRQEARAKCARMFWQIAESCGEKWCDDQRAIEAALAPLPAVHGIHKRQGVRVAFIPMKVHNVAPKSASDPATGACVLHFRGKARKQLIFEWAAQNFARLGIV